MYNRFYKPSSAETKKEVVFPFANHKDYCSNTKFRQFSQDKLLKKEENGLCLALCYEWLGGFYKTATENVFWEKIKEQKFLEQLKEMQEDFKLPHISTYDFKVKITNFAKQYGFDRSQISSRSSIEKPDISNLINQLIINNEGKIVFLSKKYFDSPDGHAIAIACKMSTLGVIQMGLFEPNFGEALFTYNVLEGSQNLRLTWEENYSHDSVEPRWRKTFYEFCVGLFQHYNSSSPYQSFKYISMRHSQSQISQKDVDFRKKIADMLCTIEDKKEKRNDISNSITIYFV